MPVRHPIKVGEGKLHGDDIIITIFPGFTTRALAAKLSRSIKQDFTFVYIGWSRHRVITPIVLSRASIA